MIGRVLSSSELGGGFQVAIRTTNIDGVIPPEVSTRSIKLYSR
jgi:hypothetical protein